MAFGIDDAIGAAASGIDLVDTCVKIVKEYRKQKRDIDIERLIDQVRVTALERIDEADKALVRLERLLRDKGVRMDQTLQQAIQNAGFWHPIESFKLREIRNSFNKISDSVYSAVDDIAALVRCKRLTEPMGVAVVASAKEKHEMNKRVLESPAIGESISILREKLVQQKALLSS